MSGYEELIGRHLEVGRGDLAAEVARKALQEDPDCAHLYGLLAMAMLQGSEGREAALECAQRGRALDPEDFTCRLAEIEVLLALNWMYDAAARAEDSLRQSPDAPMAWYQLGRAKFQAERWKEAEAAAEQGVTLAPDDVELRNLLSAARLRLKRRSDESEEIHGTLALDPENDSSHALAAVIALRDGRGADAARHARESLRLDPGDSSTLLLVHLTAKASNPVYGYVTGVRASWPRLSAFVLQMSMLGLIYAALSLVGALSDGSLDSARMLPWTPWAVLLVVLVMWWDTVWDAQLHFVPEVRGLMLRRQRLALGLQSAFHGLAAVALAGALLGIAPLCCAVLPLLAIGAQLRGLVDPLLPIHRLVHFALLAVYVLVGFFATVIGFQAEADVPVITLVTAIVGILERIISLLLKRGRYLDPHSL